MSKEEFKQDCETKASWRLSEKIKKRYPRQADFLNGIDHEGHSVNILRYEHFSLKKKGIERTIKKISSVLAASFSGQLAETEDIAVRPGDPVLN